MIIVLSLVAQKNKSHSHITGKEKLFHPEYKEKEDKCKKTFQKGLENLA